MSDPDILSPFVETHGVTVYQGDCIETMRRLPEASVDAIVTDPPYGLEFMGKEWDAPWKSGTVERVDEGTDPTHPFRDDAPRVRYGFGGGASSAFQSFSEAWAREAYRVLKPGGHLLAFAGTRTYHRMASGVEDAGFEIRDCIAWMYGSGFPKSLDVSKAIDKAAGAEREVVGERKQRGRPDGVAPFNTASSPVELLTAPATPDAAKWSGWGTALKPAFEPIVVARKPLIGTVAQNVLEHGTGALNIDGTRIGAESTMRISNAGTNGDGWGMGKEDHINGSPSGRWPANVALDEEAGAILDEQSGERPSGARAAGTYHGLSKGPIYGEGREIEMPPIAANSGGASRFFYCAKASKKDRNTNGASNTHPTVKPTELMRWLMRLVTPPGGIILDPFGGSGSTGVAAQAESVRCILIEREAEYLAIIRERLDDGSLFSQLP